MRQWFGAGHMYWVRGVLLCIVLLVGLGSTAVPAASATYTRIRVFVAVPDATVDVVANSLQLASGNKFLDLVPYSSRQSGLYGVSVFPPGKTEGKDAYVFHKNIDFVREKDYTLVIYGKAADKSIDIAVLQDNNSSDNTAGRVRFGNFAVGASALTLTTGGQTNPLGTVKFGAAGGYAPLPAGAYTFGTTESPTTPASATLTNNSIVSVFAVGVVGGSPAPSLLVSSDAGGTTVSTPVAGSAPTTAAPAMITPVPPTAAPPAAAAPPATATSGSASSSLRAALAPVSKVTDSDSKRFFDATGHTLGGKFKDYWDTHGGLEQFGYPISEEYMEVSATDGKTYTTQYFERARFELHPEKAGTPYEVLQGLLGREIIKLLGAG